MSAQNYLFVPDLSNQRNISDEFVEAFMRKAFMTNSTLFLLVKNTKESLDYYHYTMRKVFNGGGRIQLLYNDNLSLKAIINQFNCVVFGNTGREFLAINLSAGNIFNIEIPANVEQYKLMAANAVENILLKKYPPESWEYFLFHEGMGESITFFFWMKKYRETCGKKILCICFHPIRAELMNFCPYVDESINVDRLMFDFISVFYAQKYNIRRLLTAHFSPKTIAAISKLPPDEVRTYGWIGMIRDFLNIDQNAKFELYHVELPKETIARAENLFNKMNLTRNKAVFAVTSGYYYGRLEHHIDFWIKLRDKLRAKGYEIVTNANEVDIPDCRNIFMSLLETAAFAGLCGNIVSIPTGFVESLCELNTANKITLQVIYPSDNDIYWGGKPTDVDKAVDDYVYTVSRYLKSNTKFSCYKWGNNPAEDDLLLEKIVNKILTSN